MIKNANIELHVHPFIGKNTVFDVVKAMGKKNLDVVAMEALDDDVFPRVINGCKAYNVEFDSSGVKLPGGKYLLNAREYSTKEDFHLLTIGYSFNEATPDTEIRKVIDNSLENNALVLLDHPFVDNGKTRTAGHISYEKSAFLEQLCREYSGQVALEWNAYCIPWMRKGLMGLLNKIGHKIDYYDVNRRTEDLSEQLSLQKYNLPVVADTDLHARSKRHLSHIGTARITTDIEGESASEIVASMKKNIFDGNYENTRRYVPSLHLLECFCLPILFPKFFYKPRA
ncbi:hypothetical protein KY345_05470 [Candidatus Woesearchaeota archaeon]|nr:hypothetical protein [Candidatus Woesearchaeota archaeon]